MTVRTMDKHSIACAQGYLPSKLVNVETLPAGANSKIYKLTTKSGDTYCAKQYIKRPGDRRDRLNNEFTALEFLWRKSIGPIPHPIAHDQQYNIGIYTFINGKILRNNKIFHSELAQAIKFLESLHTARLFRAAKMFGSASEACFSFSQYIQIIDQRRQRFSKIRGNIPLTSQLHQWLINEWEIAWREAVELVMKRVRENRLSLSTPLAISFRTLSPSDFGFHNAIKQTDGQLVFLDFEYFGWDDPAKLIGDFFLHPGMHLTNDQKRWFLKKSITIYAQDPSLPIRLPLIYILLGCKWCLILLNCFFHATAKEELCRKQLKKAQQMLHTLRNDLHSGTMMAFLT